jgi:hypothetical protein
LTINAQATKGPGREVVKIEGLPNSNGQKWVSLNLLKEGDNPLTCSARDRSTTGHPGTSTPKPAKDYVLTSEESTTIAGLQSQIDGIIKTARARFVPTPKLVVDPTQLSPADLITTIADLERYIANLKNFGNPKPSAEVAAIAKEIIASEKK